MNNKVLILATESAAGMGPYVASMVNSFPSDTNIRFLLVETDNQYFTKNIRKDLKNSVTIIRERVQSIPEKLFRLIFKSGYSFSKEIKNYIEANEYEIVHCLSSFTDAKLAKWISRRTKFIFTVHDLEPHYTKKIFYKQWREKAVYKAYFSSLDCAQVLYTNSKEQYDKMQRIYPGRKYFSSPFPTLVTESIEQGNMVPVELSDITDYILFFGRIEAYKGVENLIAAFQKANLKRDIKLVIAGKGDLNMLVDDPRIIRINRYIDDSEVGQLYKRAGCVFYPYLSATQSGVLSISLYFNKPTYVSDLPYFREVLGDNDYMFFEPDNIDQIADKLNEHYAEPCKSHIAPLQELYDRQYGNKVIYSELHNMYSQVSE